jgi:hypothetical protein
LTHTHRFFILLSILVGPKWFRPPRQFTLFALLIIF